jgi:hypothetical protein
MISFQTISAGEAALRERVERRGATAVHEAGHVVAATLLGIPLKAVVANEEDAAKAGMSGFVLAKSFAGATKAEQAAYSVAGLAAEIALWAPSAAGRGKQSTSDRAKALEALRSVKANATEADVDALTAGLSDFFAHPRVTWAVRQLADRLRRGNGLLSGEEAQRIAADSLGADFEDLAGRLKAVITLNT